jgi:hypothetical protein
MKSACCAPPTPMLPGSVNTLPRQRIHTKKGRDFGHDIFYPFRVFLRTTYCHILGVTIDRFCVGNRIYWSLRPLQQVGIMFSLFYTVYISLEQALSSFKLSVYSSAFWYRLPTADSLFPQGSRAVPGASYSNSRLTESSPLNYLKRLSLVTDSYQFITPQHGPSLLPTVLWLHHATIVRTEQRTPHVTTTLWVHA